MIQSKKELLLYLEEDKKALGITRRTPKFGSDEVWRFERALRMYEYALNVGKNDCFHKIVRSYRKFIHHRWSVKLGFSIPANTCGKGLSISHYGMLIVNSNARIGEYCRLHTGIVVGAKSGSKAAPVIGDRVYLGMGCKILGNISVADGVVIGANAVVVKSIDEPNTTWGGIPAKKLSDRGSSVYMDHLAEEE